jgi:anti-anti-sigma factor
VSVTGQRAFGPDFAVAVRWTDAGEGAAIEVRGELDSGTCEELLETVRRAIARGPRTLSLDLRQMTFIDSAGTRALIMVERIADEHDVSLVATPPPEHVTELLRTAGLVDRIDVNASEGAPASSGFLERTEFELPRDPHSPARARAEVRECLSTLDPSELANVVLLTSELVTNAVVHPRGVGDAPVGLRLVVYEDRVRIEVEDTGDGFDQVVPVLAEGERGRGLYLVHQFSDRWGSERVKGDGGARFRVWFELGWRRQQAATATA